MRERIGRRIKKEEKDGSNQGESLYIIIFVHYGGFNGIAGRS